MRAFVAVERERADGGKGMKADFIARRIGEGGVLGEGARGLRAMGETKTKGEEKQMRLSCRRRLHTREPKVVDGQKI